ncbi:MAG: hypothetical protein WKF84_10045 [Pyrinomonadaceae bacterium]
MHNSGFITRLLVLSSVPVVIALSADVEALQSREDHLSLGKSLAAREQWHEAERHFRLHQQAYPNSSEAIVHHARSLFELNQPFDAIIELEELLEREPESVPALKLYAALLDLVVKASAKAEEVLVKTSKLAPTDMNVWQALGVFYLTHNKTDDAIRCFTEATRLSPSDPLLLASLCPQLRQCSSPRRGKQAFYSRIKAQRAKA